MARVPARLIDRAHVVVAPGGVEIAGEEHGDGDAKEQIGARLEGDLVAHFWWGLPTTQEAILVHLQ